MEAAVLLRTLAKELEQGHGVGSMSCSAYDTAWVSCVSKAADNGFREWLLPSSFLSVIDSQHPDGGWHWPPQESQQSEDCTILSSLASLFAITQHIKHPYQLVDWQNGLEDRLGRGKDFVARHLMILKPRSDYGVGFEVLVPALLDLLERENIEFHFPGRQTLLRRRNVKLSKAPINQLNRVPSTLLHSLEAFYGNLDLDFDSLRDELIYGSVMASPSATAAYLMRNTTWDDSAEAYLHLTISRGAGHGSGRVPSAFPSGNFELIWVTVTLLKARYIGGSLGIIDTDHILDLLGNQIVNHGLFGFAPGIQPDVDDSANASIIFSLLERPGLSRQIRERFEGDNHFMTYEGEVGESPSANCNVLLALLLNLKHDSGAITAVEKVAKYLTSKWLNANGSINDKWNVSEFYSIMLLAQAFMKLVECWEKAEIDSFREPLLLDHILLVAFRSLLRILLSQHSDGSWGSRGPREETAYVLLTLVELAELPLASALDQEINLALLRGRAYLQARKQPDQTEYLWVEKVLYGAPTLSRSYVLAALAVTPVFPRKDMPRITGYLNVDYSGMVKFTKTLQATPLLAPHSRWLINASWIEGQLFLPMLHEARQAVFSRAGMTKDKYFSWIPSMWTLADNINGFNTSTRLLCSMMQVSTLNFQVDEFMETIPEDGNGDHIALRQQAIEELFVDNPLTKMANPWDGNIGVPSKPVPQITLDNHDAASVTSHSSISLNLQSFISYVTEIAKLACVPQSSISLIHTQLKAFLHAHLIQGQLNRDFSSKKRTKDAPNTHFVYQGPSVPSFRTWLHTVGAVHTSCPYSFKLYLALIGAAQRDSSLQSVKQRYLADDLCEHLSRLCRLYNDYGSLKRDSTEDNLNSVNFPEIQTATRDFNNTDVQDPPAGEKMDGDEPGTLALVEEERFKKELMKLADWERKGLENSLKELEEDPQTDKKLMEALKVFVDVTDLFGQVYVVKDLASRKI